MNATGNRKHALCSASSAERWLQCPGSVGLSREVPEEPPSPYAEEGTRAHALAEEALRAWLAGGKDPATVAFGAPVWGRIAAREGLPLPGTGDEPSMLDFVHEYVWRCLETVEEFTDSRVAFEQSLTLSGELQMFGTADMVVTGIDKRTGAPGGAVRDLKYGTGKKVVAVGNAQMAYYAVALKRCSSKRLERVRVAVDQPRIKNGLTVVEYSPDELGHWHGVLTRGAEKAYMQMVMPHTREFKEGAYCWFCPCRRQKPDGSGAYCPEYGKGREARRAASAAEDFND